MSNIDNRNAIDDKKSENGAKINTFYLVNVLWNHGHHIYVFKTLDKVREFFSNSRYYDDVTETFRPIRNIIPTVYTYKEKPDRIVLDTGEAFIIRGEHVI